jgi:hypothetical protein
MGKRIDENNRQQILKMELLPKSIREKLREMGHAKAYEAMKVEWNSLDTKQGTENNTETPEEVKSIYFETCVTSGGIGAVIGFATGGPHGAYLGFIGGCSGAVLHKANERRKEKKWDHSYWERKEKPDMHKYDNLSGHGEAW